MSSTEAKIRATFHHHLARTGNVGAAIVATLDEFKEDATALGWPEESIEAMLDTTFRVMMRLVADFQRMQAATA